LIYFIFILLAALLAILPLADTQKIEKSKVPKDEDIMFLGFE